MSTATAFALPLLVIRRNRNEPPDPLPEKDVCLNPEGPVCFPPEDKDDGGTGPAVPGGVLPRGTPCCPQLAVLAGLPVGTGIGTIFLFLSRVTLPQSLKSKLDTTGYELYNIHPACPKS